MPVLKKPKKQRTLQINRQDRQDIYKSNKWKQLRHSKLLSNPLCELCLMQGKITPAVDVHHSDSFANYQGQKRLEVAYDYDNLVSLCKQCHSWVHRNGTTHHTDIALEARLKR